MNPVIVHCHFYQPPRENPWTGAIDPEDSARPFHDWNERIHGECYRPNGFARIFDSRGDIVRIVNNYASVSFNFGPTLLSWIERVHPHTYARILAADGTSLRTRHGHGNAIAQAYNHAILPLCNARDQHTQIVWGIAAFRHSFDRLPEAMWLPETACNDATLGALIDAGMRYVILSPHQAERVRPLAGGEWLNVADGSVDPRLPYRYLHRDGSGRSLAVFLYDGAAARAIAFEGALSSSQALVDRLEQARGPEDTLVHVATDGETYGHHSHFGDRSLAYAMEVEAPRRGFQVTNYGEFLELHPPSWEVEVKAGPDGEGTAWSCEHGVGRWARDCGCQGGGGEGWNQAWRAPLRAAFDDLRDYAAQAFEEYGGYLFHDPWRAREGYIDLVLDRETNRETALAQLAGRHLHGDEQSRALRLLEMQRSAMLMYTSCGWFFSDISGIETVQVMKYAGRVLDLMSELGITPPEGRLLERLAEAKSNLPEMGTGADVYRRFVQPCRATPGRIAAHLAITGLAGDGGGGIFGDYSYRKQHHRRRQHGRLTLAIGRLILESTLSGERYDYSAAALHLGGLDFYCALHPFRGAAHFKDAAQKVWERMGSASLPALLRMLQEEFGPEEFGLDDLLPGGRHAMCEIVYGELLNGFSAQFSNLLAQFERVAQMLEGAGFELPAPVRQFAEFTLGNRLEAEIQRNAGSTNVLAYGGALKIASEIARHGYRVDLSAANTAFGAMIAEAVEGAVAEPGPATVNAALELIALARRLGLQANLEIPQEALCSATIDRKNAAQPLRPLAAALGLSMNIFTHREETASADSAAITPRIPAIQARTSR
jgi:alpha-amylase/alpha-mannosidase (GH57 family)